MPTVPYIDAPRIDATVGQATRYDAPAMPDIAGKQMQQMGQAEITAGNTAVKIIDRIQAEKDDALTQELDNKFADRLRVLIHDPEHGYLARVGKGAVDSVGEYQKAIDTAREEVTGGLENDVQRKMFNKVADRRVFMAMQTMDGHAMQQLKVYRTGEAKAGVDSARMDATANWANWKTPDGTFAQFKAAMLSRANQMADIAELPADSDQRKQFVVGTTTQLHSDVIGSMVSMGQASQAREYLSANVKEIAPDKLDNLQNLVKQAGVKEDSLTLSMQIKGTLPQQTAEADRLFKAGDITAEVHDALVQRFEHNWQIRKAQRDEGNKAAMGAAQEWILKNPGKTVLDMPANLYQWAKQEGHLVGLDAFAQREGRPASRQAELTVRGELLNQAMTDPDTFIAEFRRTNFSDRMDLGTQGIKEMQNIAAEMLRGNGKYRMTFDQKVLQDALPGDLLKSGNKDKRDAFVAIMAEEGDKWKKANPGKEPDAKAYQQVIQAANQEWVSVGRLWNSTVPAYKARANQDVRAMPKDFYDGLKSRGATEEEILAAWNLKKGK